MVGLFKYVCALSQKQSPDLIRNRIQMTMLLEPLPHYYKSESSFKYVLCVFLDLLEIDGQMAPQDKLACLVKCSKNIFEILKVSNENPASADDFLPCLIYICLKANPPRFVSYILISFLVLIFFPKILC